MICALDSLLTHYSHTVESWPARVVGAASDDASRTPGRPPRNLRDRYFSEFRGLHAQGKTWHPLPPKADSFCVSFTVMPKGRTERRPGPSHGHPPTWRVGMLSVCADGHLRHRKSRPRSRRDAVGVARTAPRVSQSSQPEKLVSYYTTCLLYVWDSGRALGVF